MRHQPPLTRLSSATLVGLLLFLLFSLSVASPSFADDRDLLRTATANPYLFILLDTSTSMSLKVGENDEPAVGYGDDPDSRLYAAKAALYHVFKDVTDVNFGFASFNQDELRVIAKHYLYYIDTSIGSGWPLNWPTPDLDGLTQNFVDEDIDGDGVPDQPDGLPDADIEAGVDVLAFGRHIAQTPVGVAGTCASPLDLDDTSVRGDRAKANAFPKLHLPSSPQTTTLWLEEGGQTYRLQLTLTSGTLGDATIQVEFVLDEVVSCSGPFTTGTNWTIPVTLRSDVNLNEFLMVDEGDTSADEDNAALWPWLDPLDDTTCGGSNPFSGKGWEGNYDGGGISTGSPPFDTNLTNVDRYCAHGNCSDLKVNPTVLNPLSRTLDQGDVVPWDWNGDNKLEFLQRLAPNYPFGIPDFRVSSHLTLDSVTGLYGATTRKPIMAVGDTPLAKAINDFRCWFLGDEGAGAAAKCSQNAFFQEGWSSVACTYDSRWGCRRPFLLIISDGKDNCPGENPAADSNAMNNSSGLEVWALNLGDPDNCRNNSGGSLKSVTTNGGGQCVNVANRQQLIDTLQDLLARVREVTRAFASAAVPTVQATADQGIFLSNFTPVRNRSTWDGHLNGFLKPLPVDADGFPDTSTTCASKPADQQSSCFLWDAGAVIRDQQLNTTDYLGNNANQRRVYYTKLSTSGTWDEHLRLLDPTVDGDPDDIRYDLWRGLSLVAPTAPDGSLTAAQETATQTQANLIIDRTFSLKTATLDTGEYVEYVMGDIFHFDPIAISQPANILAFASDTSGGTCDLSASSSRGYRCFFRRHQFRRHMLAIGTNDGMVRLVNTGTYSDTDKKFDNGSGHELFAYIPRAVLPRVRELAEGTRHRYSVDGGALVADVFIHPGHNGTPVAASREWRTVLVGSLREGGRGYYALDITQPDKLTINADGQFIPDDDGDYVPSCITDPTDSSCGPVPFGSAVWEFDDSIYDSVTPKFVQLDENNNGEADLGFTWSRPNIGVIRYCAGSTPCDPTAVASVIEKRHVAIFGGGLDPQGKFLEAPAYGNWLYIVDIETGNVLYKRALLGSAASEPAAVDVDNDGFLDRIYIGTTAGYMYRVDLGVDASGNLPALASQNVLGLDGTTYTVDRIPTAYWQPRVLFDTIGPLSATDSSTLVRRPLFFRPSILFVPKLGLYALAFGSGDREDLWSRSAAEGRFYVFVDDTNSASPRITEAALTVLDATTAGAISGDLLLSGSPGQRGWVLALEKEERVITDAFALSGVTVFSSFRPATDITTDPDAPPPTEPDDPDAELGCGDRFVDGGLCSRGGLSRLYVVNTTNGNGFLYDGSGNTTRYDEVSEFVTNPYSEVGQTKNSGDGTEGGLTMNQQQVMEALKALFPANCKFANYRIDIRTVAADTTVQHIASVPICLIEKNWKEF